MNDDDFEKKLRALTGALHRPDPTPAWKSEILARARCEAGVIPLHRTLPPRWLMFSWAAAWAAILLLNLTAPTETPSTGVGTFAGVEKKRPAAASVELTASPQTLFAFQHRMDLNLDQP